jgi:hypothetical protein
MVPELLKLVVGWLPLGGNAVQYLSPVRTIVFGALIVGSWSSSRWAWPKCGGACGAFSICGRSAPERVPHPTRRHRMPMTTRSAVAVPRHRRPAAAAGLPLARTAGRQGTKAPGRHRHRRLGADDRRVRVRRRRHQRRHQGLREDRQRAGGIKGRKLRYVPEDTGYKVDVSVAAFKKITSQNKVNLYYGDSTGFVKTINPELDRGAPC